MARNISVSPDMVVDGVNVIFAGTLDEAIWGPDYWKVDYKARSVASANWMLRNGAHYYAEEKWCFDEDDRMYPGFSVHKGVRQAKRFGARIVVCENLS